MKVYAIVVDFKVYDHIKDAIITRQTVDRAFYTKKDAEERLDYLREQVFSDDDFRKNATYHIEKVPFYTPERIVIISKKG